MFTNWLRSAMSRKGQGTTTKRMGTARRRLCLEPLETRTALGLGLAMSLNAPIPDYRVGIFRM